MLPLPRGSTPTIFRLALLLIVKADQIQIPKDLWRFITMIPLTCRPVVTKESLDVYNSNPHQGRPFANYHELTTPGHAMPTQVSPNTVRMKGRATIRSERARMAPRGALTVQLPKKY